MLVEGPQAVRELALHRPFAVRDVYVREDAWETHADVVDVAGATPGLVDDVGAEQLTQAHRRLPAACR